MLTYKPYILDGLIKMLDYPINVSQTLKQVKSKIDVLIIDHLDQASVDLIKEPKVAEEEMNIFTSQKRYVKYLIHLGNNITMKKMYKNLEIQKQISVPRPLSLLKTAEMLKCFIHDHLPFFMIDEKYILDCQSNRLFGVNDPSFNIHLTEREMQIIQHMLLSHHYTSTKQNISAIVWDFEYSINTSSIETCIYKLRNKLGNIISIEGSKYFLNINEVY